MVSLRKQFDPDQAEARFNVLLTADREHATEHWSRQLPRLLGPQGVRAWVVRTGREAFQMAGSIRFHAALIDISTPTGNEIGRTASGGYPGGLWLLEIFRRLPSRPPTVVLNNNVYAPRQAQRYVNDALRLGAFTVINGPVEVEGLLAVIRRVVDRQYRGQWPVATTTDPEAEPD